MKKLTCEPYLLPNLSRQLSKIRQDPIATSALADTAAPELESSWTRSSIVPLSDPSASLTSKLSASRASISTSGQPCPAVLIPPLKQEHVSSCKLAVLRKGPNWDPFSQLLGSRAASPQGSVGVPCPCAGSSCPPSSSCPHCTWRQHGIQCSPKKEEAHVLDLELGSSELMSESNHSAHYTWRSHSGL